MNVTQTRELYSSPNGDRWYLGKDASDRVFVLHQANVPSGGQISKIELSASSPEDMVRSNKPYCK